jgi:hypothetical protein
MGELHQRMELAFEETDAMLCMLRLSIVLESLERDMSAAPQLACFVHLGHATGAKRAQHPITASYELRFLR